MYCLALLDKYGLLLDDSLKGKNLKVMCPFHVEKTPSLLFNMERDSFYCFGCEAKGDILDFVCELEGCDPIKALKIIHGLEDIAFKGGAQYSSENAKQETIKTIVEANKYFASIPAVNWHDYSGKDFRFNYMLRRKFTCDTLEKFEVKVNVYSEYPILIPIYQFGRFKGYLRRRVSKSENGEPKYLYNKGLRKKYVVAGINDWPDRKMPLLICEGIIDMMTAYQYGYKNVCATLGWAISDYQAEKINKYNEKVICALDNDDAGGAGYDRLVKYLGNDRVFKLNISPAKDINEMEEKDFIISAKNILKTIRRKR